MGETPVERYHCNSRHRSTANPQTQNHYEVGNSGTGTGISQLRGDHGTTVDMDFNEKWGDERDGYSNQRTTDTSADAGSEMSTNPQLRKRKKKRPHRETLQRDHK